MAATLMEIKSRALLPKPPKDEEEDPKEELLRRLEEYRQIKEASKALRIYEAEAAEMVARLPMEIVTDARVELGSLSLRALQEALLRVLLRAERNEAAPPRRGRFPGTTSPSGSACCACCTACSSTARWSSPSSFPWTPRARRSVTTFLALLELLKANRVTLRQEEIYAPIVIAEGKGEGT